MSDEKIPVYEIFQKGEKAGFFFNKELADKCTEYLNATTISLSLGASDVMEDKTEKYKSLLKRVAEEFYPVMDARREHEQEELLNEIEAELSVIPDRITTHDGMSTLIPNPMFTENTDKIKGKIKDESGNFSTDAYAHIAGIMYVEDVERYTKRIIEYCRHIAKTKGVAEALLAFEEIAKGNMNEGTYKACEQAILRFN